MSSGNHSCPAYQNILFDNVQQLANFIIGKRITLQLAIPPMTIQRSDLIELQYRILAMTPVERKRLGINTSTFWYQKKKLVEGKSIKVYNKVISKLA